MTHESAQLVKTMLEDALFIHEGEIESLKKKGYNVLPFFNKSDISKTLDMIYEYDLEKEYELSPVIKLKLLYNKHILGSCSYQMWFKNENSVVKSVVFTGDLGNTRIDNYFTYKKQFEQINCNAIICESTYGSSDRVNINKRLREYEIKEIEKDIKYTLIEKKGSVIFPCFSLQRSQLILKIIYDIFQRNKELEDYKVVLDGRLTNLVTDIYKNTGTEEDKKIIEELLNWKNLKRVKDYEGTKTVISDEEPKCILTSQGFIMAGHSVVYTEAYVKQSKNTFIFTGFAPENSPAYKLKKKEQKKVKINKSDCEIKADTKEYNSFSSHIQFNQIIQLLTGGKIKDNIILIHGSTEAKLCLKENVEEILAQKYKTTKVNLPKRGQIIKI